MWAIVFLVACTAISGYFAWSFQAGRFPYDGPRRVEGVMRLTMLNFGYLMLPAVVGSSAFTVLAIVVAFDPEKTVLMKSVVVAGVVVIFVSGIWLFKELCQPSRRRTPDWLVRERRDAR